MLSIFIYTNMLIFIIDILQLLYSIKIKFNRKKKYIGYNNMFGMVMNHIIW